MIDVIQRMEAGAGLRQGADTTFPPRIRAAPLSARPAYHILWFFEIREWFEFGLKRGRIH
jgi:hypothetical protein